MWVKYENSGRIIYMYIYLLKSDKIKGNLKETVIIKL